MAIFYADICLKRSKKVLLTMKMINNEILMHNWLQELTKKYINNNLEFIAVTQIDRTMRTIDNCSILYL